LRVYVGFCLAELLLVLAVWWVSPRLMDAAKANAVTAAAVICFGAAAVALLPVVLVAPRYPDYIMQAGLGAMLLRLVLTLAVGAWYLWAKEPPRSTFMMSAVLFYLVALAAETWIAIDSVRRYWKAPQRR
jgi:hypothetical protein